MSSDLRLLLASLALATGCGPLADGSYPGEVLFTLSGNVMTGDGLDYFEEDLRVSVFWAGDEQTTEERNVVLSTSFPARYELEIYAYPPDSAMIEAPWSQGQYAVGMPLLYLDRDGDGRWSGEEEPLVGGADEEVVLFAEEAGDEVDDQVHQGFQRMYAEGARVACDGSEAGVEELWPSEEADTNLIVGEWWLELVDWDCDEDLFEWDDLCPTGEDLRLWCEEIADELEGDIDEREVDDEEYLGCSELCEDVLER